MAFTTLVQPEELAAHLDDPSWVVCDCRFDLTAPEAGQKAYAASHIPGAHYLHLELDLAGPVREQSGRHPLPHAETLGRRLGDLGVGRDSQVVAYDAAGGALAAARLWWLLRWLGHEAVAVLDGGWPRWQAGGYPVTTELPKPQPQAFSVRRQDGLWLDTVSLEAWRTADQGILLDARAPARFRGQQEPVDPVAGHIPGARNAPFANNLDAQGCFRPPQVLADRYRALLAGCPPRHAVVMCGSGVTACHDLLAMAIAGLDGPRLYAGSWSAWIRDPRRSVATGDT